MRVRNLSIVAAILLYGQSTLANDFHDLSKIETEITSFLLDYYESDSNESIRLNRQVNFEIKSIDSRLKLFQCDEPLSLSLTDNGNAGGNIAVKTQCNGSKPWAIYVSAKVSVMEDGIVAVNNLPKGTILTLDHLETVSINTSDSNAQFATDFNQLIGKAISRSIQRGKPIRLTNLNQPTVVKRGESVMIEAQSGQITVATSATAMSDGRIGEQISVKNNQSKQVVNATVLATGRVGVKL